MHLGLSVIYASARVEIEQNPVWPFILKIRRDIAGASDTCKSPGLSQSCSWSLARQFFCIGRAGAYLYCHCQLLGSRLFLPTFDATAVRARSEIQSGEDFLKMSRVWHGIVSVTPRLRLLSPFSRPRWGYTQLESTTIEMSSRDSYEEKSDVKEPGVVVSEVGQHHVAFTNDQVDTAAQLVAGQDFELDPEEALRIRKKIDWHILPMMCSTFLLRLPIIMIYDPQISSTVLYWVQFMDKTTLGSAAILGIR